MSEFVRAFGDAVRERRRAKSLSQEGLGALAGIHRTYVGMIERAEKNITLDNVVKIARALGLKPSDLLRDAEGRL